MTQNKWTLIDLDQHHVPADFTVTASDFRVAQPAFAVHKRRLHGGLREGVEVIDIDNGRFRFSVLPTRGMGLWKGWLGEMEIGWQSPIRGPVHPQFVPIAEGSGLGWLDGFDEWLVRCGLESNGAPEFDERGILKHPLHGRIANRPASHVELEVDVPGEAIRLTGIVEESRFLCRNLQLRTTITTRFGQAGLSIRDEVTNLATTPSDFQLLYHINFGQPLLEPRRTLVAPVKTLVPRGARAAEGIAGWQTYEAPQSGFAEQVYFLDLCDREHWTQVMLKNHRGTHGASLAFDKRQFPCFTLWKNTGAVADGYVTGLEPATNYPNPRSYEAAQGRVIKLGPGEQARFDLEIGLHANANDVALVEAEIASLQQSCSPKIFKTPQAGWTQIEAG